MYGMTEAQRTRPASDLPPIGSARGGGWHQGWQSASVVDTDRRDYEGHSGTNKLFFEEPICNTLLSSLKPKLILSWFLIPVTCGAREIASSGCYQSHYSR